MSRFESLDWPRLLSELVVIVLGVLLALGADSLWQSRSDRVRESQILSDLFVEFQSNAELLAEDIDANRASHHMATRLSQVLKGEAAASGGELSALQVGMWDGGRFDPETGALRSVIDGGDLRLIRNGGLRQALAGFGDLAAEAKETHLATVQISVGLFPLILAIAPGELTPAQRTVLTSNELASQRANYQLIPLLDVINDIIAAIESELEG